MAHEVHVGDHNGHGEPEDNPATFGFAIFFTIIAVILITLLLII